MSYESAVEIREAIHEAAVAIVGAVRLEQPTLREWFAGQALNGFIANSDLPDLMKKGFAPDKAAEVALMCADAIMARSRKPPEGLFVLVKFLRRHRDWCLRAIKANVDLPNFDATKHTEIVALDEALKPFEHIQ